VLPDLHYRTTDEMLKEFEFLDDPKLINDIVIENTYAFNELVENDIQPLQSKLAMPHIAGAPEKLRELVEARAKFIYGDDIKPNILARMNKELDSIIGHGYSIVY
jgi:DNA polymerase-3 subunit alpha (Gram-positive type)